MTGPPGFFGLPSSGRTALFLALLVSAAFVAIRALVVDAPPIEMSLISTFSSFGYASIGCTYFLCAGPADRRRLFVRTFLIVVGLALGLTVATAFNGLNLGKALLVAAGAAGVLGYVRDVRSARHGPDRLERLAGLRDALIVPVATAQVTYWLWPHTRLNPVYDTYIHVLEHSLGIVYEPAVTGLYSALYPWSHVATACYLALPIGLSVLALKQETSALRTRVLMAVALTGNVGFLLYQICPVVGPMQSIERVFGVPLTEYVSVTAYPIDAPGRVPRNGMPSLHAVWAFLIVLNSRSLAGRWRLAAAIFALLNLVASLGRYQHWFMDHVVAIPMTAAIQLAVVNHPPRAPRSRWSLVVAHAVVTFAWLVAFRYGLLTTAPPWLTGCAVIATVALPGLSVWPGRAHTKVLPASGRRQTYSM